MIDFNAFIRFCKGLQGQTFATRGGRAQFKLESAQDNGIDYIVESTNKTRHSTRRYIEKVLYHYTVTGSLRPRDYQHISRNASYTLSLLKLYLDHLCRIPQEAN